MDSSLPVVVSSSEDYPTSEPLLIVDEENAGDIVMDTGRPKSKSQLKTVIFGLDDRLLASGKTDGGRPDIEQSNINSDGILIEPGEQASKPKRSLLDRILCRKRKKNKRIGRRLRSLDLFRGLDMFLMIIVDNQGNFDYVYEPFNESRWNGLHVPSDCVFPTFLFIVGVAVALSMNSSRHHLRSGKLWYRIVKRTFLLFLIGFLLNFFASNCNVHKFRIMGVLQRISLCYIAVVLLFLFLPASLQWFCVSVMIAVYCIIFYGFKTSDECGRGKVTDDCNVAGYLDRKIFGSYMHHPTDSEGLLSTIPAILTTFLGLQLGRLIIYSKARARREQELSKENSGSSEKSPFYPSFLFHVIVIAAVEFAVGWILTIWIPINKKIWSLSFTFVVASLSQIVFLFHFIVVDVWLCRAVRFVISRPRVVEAAHLYERNHPHIPSENDSLLGSGLSYHAPRTSAVKSCTQSIIGSIEAVGKWSIQPMLWLGTNPILVFVGMVVLEILLLDTFHCYRNGKKTSIWLWMYWEIVQPCFQYKELSSLVFSLVHCLLWIGISGLCYRAGFFVKL